jgi:hypothetical protein
VQDISQITLDKLASRQIGHLGLVAGIIDELGITGILNKELPKNVRSHALAFQHHQGYDPERTRTQRTTYLR